MSGPRAKIAVGRMVVYLLFVVAVAAVTAGWARHTDQRLERAAVASCERGNLIRAELNRRAQAVQAYVIENSVEATPERASALVRLAEGFGAIRLVNCRAVVHGE